MSATLTAVITGLQTTFQLALALVLGCLVCGVISGAQELSPFPFMRWVSRIFIEVFRGIPVVVSLFFVFFLLPVLGIRFSPFIAALVGIGLWGSANIAEITRGALTSVSRDQWLCAEALGFTRSAAVAHVIFPIATRRAIPPLVSFLSNLIQTTTLASIIGVPEVLASARQAIERVQVFEGVNVAAPTYIVIFAIFFAISFPLTYGSRVLESRLEH